MKHLQIIPHSKLENNRVEHFAQQLCMYRSMFERWNKKERRLDKNFLSWEMVLQPKNTQFVVTMPQDLRKTTEKSILSTWSNVTTKEIPDPFEKFTPTYASTMELRYHYFLSIKVDRRINWLNSLLETLNIMKDEDKVIMQTLCFPAHYDWYESATENYERFKTEGHMPLRFHFNKRDIAHVTGKAIASTVIGTMNFIGELVAGKDAEKIPITTDRAIILKDGQLRSETLQKTKNDAYHVQIRIAIQSKDEKQAVLLNRSVSTAFRELDGDNQLINYPANREKTFKRMKERKKKISMYSDYMSIQETSRLFMLPTYHLQDRYHIESIKQLETDIPMRLFEGGLLLGEQTYKGETKSVYMPITNKDELCLPTAVIGGMGQGKTDGYGATRMVEAVRNGFGALFIDPAKHQVTNQLRETLDSSQYEIINIAKLKPSFDWCEAQYSQYGKGLLADAVLSFFEDSLEDSVQTERYLRAFIIGMKTPQLKEIFEIMEDKEYLSEVIKTMQEGIHKQTLIQYSKESDNMRMKIIKPIYNRMDMIMGDPFLMDCFNSDKSIDFVEIMSQKKAFVFDIAKKDGLTPKQINIIGNLLMTKINLAMQMRKEKDQFPFFVVVDEPHQFNRSAKLWESMAVESRKWRVGFVWLFHYWEQLPKKAQQAIKNALPHYHLYPTSKETFKAFLEELAPFELADCLKLKRYHAFNILRTGGENTKPFIAKMSLPPCMRKKEKSV
ncbi:ATP-binding protein [Bacillus sp. S13(2024)]|uniref:ATP-binding protein n=1 Tax=Bacillus sp. S13(2024) TaxID=3162885 RepID=UPI003D1D9452